MEKRKLGLIIPFISILVLALGGFSVVKANQWINTYGGPQDDNLYSLQQTSDDGFIAAGSIGSFESGHEAAWVLKLNSSGRIVWQKIYKKVYEDVYASSAQSVQQTSDGGYIVSGIMYTGDHDSMLDAWVAKLDASGNVLWEKTYDIRRYDWHTLIRQTRDGGYIMAISSWIESFWFACAILKLDANGNISWQKKMRNIEYIHFSDVQQDGDGNYIAAGFAFRRSSPSGGPLVMKLDQSGNILFQKLYIGANELTSIKPTGDGGYIVLSGVIYLTDPSANIILLKLDTNGQIQWQKSFGGEYMDSGRTIQQTSDGGFIIAGELGSSDENDAATWILKLTANGQIQWQKIYGGSEFDSARSIQQTTDGDYIMAGVTRSIGEGGQDGWIIKLNENEWTPDCALVSTSNIEAGQTEVTTSDFDISVGDLAITPVAFSSDVEDTQVLAQSWCWRAWEGSFDVLDWLDRAMICLKWPSGVGVGVPERCPPGGDCRFCLYEWSRYMQAKQIPDFLLKIYSQMIPILNEGIDQTDLKNTLQHLERQFGEAAIGPFYTETLKASILSDLKRSKKISPQLRGKLVEAVNAIELDLSAPHKSEAEIKAGKYSAVDFDGVARVVLNNVQKSGKATLKIKHGLPASAKGMLPAWPIASYEFSFKGALAKNGYLDISFYIGGISLAGRISDARLLQWDGKHYKDITTHIDSERGVITGKTNRLSTYTIMNPRARVVRKLNYSKP